MFQSFAGFVTKSLFWCIAAETIDAYVASHRKVTGECVQGPLTNSERIDQMSTPNLPGHRNAAFEEAREMLRCRWVLDSIQPQVERNMGWPVLPRAKKLPSNSSGR